MHDPLDRSAGRRSGGVSGRLTGMSTPPALPVRPSGPESGPAPQPSSSRTLEPRSRRVLQLWDRARPVVRTSGRARDRRRCPDAPAAAVDGERDRGAAGGPDEAFNKRYPHLDHYKSAYAQGTRFYDDHGTPLNPEQAARYE